MARKRIRSFTWLIVIIVIAVIAFAVFGNQKSLPTKLSADALSIAAKRNISRRVSVEGTIVAQDRREVYFTTQSKVKELKARTGMRVNKDDLLAVTTITVSGRDVRTEIKAPIAGLVTNSNFEEGDLVMLATPAIVIQNDSQLLVESIVNENDIISVQAGQSAELIIPAISLEQKFNATVSNVYPAPANETGAVGYLIKLLPGSLPGNVRLGMSTDVEIVTATASNVIAVPDSYIVEKDDKVFVKGVRWLDAEKTNYEIFDIEVKLGLRTDEYTEISSGLDENTELVSPSFTTKREFSFFGG